MNAQKIINALESVCANQNNSYPNTTAKDCLACNTPDELCEISVLPPRGDDIRHALDLACGRIIYDALSGEYDSLIESGAVDDENQTVAGIAWEKWCNGDYLGADFSEIEEIMRDYDGETRYNVWLRDANSCFFAGIADDESAAIAEAIANYTDKYPYWRECLDDDFDGSDDDYLQSLFRVYECTISEMVTC